MKFSEILLICAFLFFLGSMLGWVLEVFFRRFFSAKKWINPGFLTGPYLPIYGFGLTGLFMLSRLPIETGTPWLNSLLIILIMGASMTLIEYLGGLIFIKGMKIKLWDYSNRLGNIQGIICPLFSLIWLLFAAAFYFVMTEPVLKAVNWFVNHMGFAFFVGMFMGIFLIDLCHSLNLSMRIRKFAKEHEIVVHFEKLKESVKDHVETFEQRHASFCFPFRSARKLADELESYAERVQNDLKSRKKQ